jgi:hypothetical protein
MAYALKIYTAPRPGANVNDARWFDLLNINAKVKFGYFPTWELRQFQLTNSRFGCLISGFILLLLWFRLLYVGILPAAHRGVYPRW